METIIEHAVRGGWWGNVAGLGGEEGNDRARNRTSNNARGRKAIYRGGGGTVRKSDCVVRRELYREGRCKGIDWRKVNKDQGSERAGSLL